MREVKPLTCVPLPVACVACWLSPCLHQALIPCKERGWKEAMSKASTLTHTHTQWRLVYTERKAEIFFFFFTQKKTQVYKVIRDSTKVVQYMYMRSLSKLRGDMASSQEAHTHTHSQHKSSLTHSYTEMEAKALFFFFTYSFIHMK